MINGVIQLLVNDATVKSLVGKNKEDNKWKVYPVVCPQPEQHPYVILRITGRAPEYCKGEKPTDFTYSFNVWCYAKTYQLVNEIDDSITDLLSNYEGTSDGVVFKEIRFVTAKDEAVQIDSGDMLYARVLSFECDV